MNTKYISKKIMTKNTMQRNNKISHLAIKMLEILPTINYWRKNSEIKAEDKFLRHNYWTSKFRVILTDWLLAHRS